MIKKLTEPKTIDAREDLISRLAARQQGDPVKAAASHDRLYILITKRILKMCRQVDTGTSSVHQIRLQLAHINSVITRLVEAANLHDLERLAVSISIPKGEIWQKNDL